MGISSFAITTQKAASASRAVYAGNLIARRPALKSTQDKLERQQKTQKQVDFFTNQKEKLKDVKCATLEDIARKLDMFHAYEEQIAAVKKQYNSEQMFHILDEARELGEKIAEAAEKSAPKTPEERKEEMVEEALGIDENDGMLDDMLEDTSQMQDELAKDMEGALEEIEAEAELENVSESELMTEEVLGKDEFYEDINLMMKEELHKVYKSVDIII